jgi:hypothetical protein
LIKNPSKKFTKLYTKNIMDIDGIAGELVTPFDWLYFIFFILHEKEKLNLSILFVLIMNTFVTQDVDQNCMGILIG